MKTPSTFAPVNRRQFHNMLPKNSDNASLIALLYMRLGGSFHETNSDKRVRGVRFANVNAKPEDLPQLPNAEPWEMFLNGEQWSGAIRMLGYLLDRLEDGDIDFIFDNLATSVPLVRKGAR